MKSRNEINKILSKRFEEGLLNKDLKGLFTKEQVDKYLEFLLKENYLSKNNIVRWNEILSTVYIERELDPTEYMTIEKMTYVSLFNFPKEVSEYYKVKDLQSALTQNLINAPVVVEVSERLESDTFFISVALPIISQFMQENLETYGEYLKSLEML